MSINLPQILTEHGVPVRSAGEHHHVTSDYVGVDCPWCSPGSGKFRLGIRLDGRGANCWTCGPHRVGDALMQLTGQPWPAVRKWMESAPGSPRASSPGLRRAGRVKIPSGVGALGRRHRAYLRGRGFDPDWLSTLWGVRGIGIAARLSWRLFIPIRDREGIEVSWTTRSIADRTREYSFGGRYINARQDAETMSPKDLLYGAELARGSVIVCEGPTDAWRIGPGGVALMGLGYSRRQVELLAEYPVRAVCFDAEPQAQARAMSLVRELAVLPGETHLVELESGGDVAEANSGEVEAIRSRFLKVVP